MLSFPLHRRSPGPVSIYCRAISLLVSILSQFFLLSLGYGKGTRWGVTGLSLTGTPETRGEHGTAAEETK